MKFLMFVVIFFIVSALLIVSNNNLRMNEQQNIEKFSELYSGWINHIFFNFKVLTGNAIKLDWFPQNSTQG